MKSHESAELEAYTTSKPGQWFVRVLALIKPISCRLCGIEFKIRLDQDMKQAYGRLFIQFCYESPCTKYDTEKMFRGRKWYLSEYMTDDEIVKTVYAAFEACVKHEIMEGFKYDGVVVFNPHVDFRALLEVSHREVSREEQL